MEADNDILIAGGGLAGLTCAIHLLKAGFQVTLIEKNQYPQHKVCGEYISNEVLPYLKWLGADPGTLNPSHISRLQVSSIHGKTIECRLPLGGFGVSRYALDNFLYTKAINSGCTILHEKIVSVSYQNNLFQVQTSKRNLSAKIAIGAFGKRSVLDYQLDRDFIHQKSPWLAVKAHYRGSFDDDLVALHNFKGGYCGISRVEQGLVNVCYLAQYDEFKKYRNLEHYQQDVLFRNPNLKKTFGQIVMESQSPLTIAQVSFQRKEAVNEHMLFIGDAAGLIHPLCGNGMAMAIHSAKICAELLTEHLKKETIHRNDLEKSYQKQWQSNFGQRLTFGRWLSSIMIKEQLATPALSALTYFPSLLTQLVRFTHGKPLIPSNNDEYYL